MGRRKRKKAAALAAESGAKPRKKKHRLRKLVVFSSIAGALAAWRQKQLGENERGAGPR
jgi:hypothetical protein